MQETVRTKIIDAGSLEEFPIKISKEVIVEGIPLAVFRLGDDEFYTIKNECPHQKGPLSQGIISGEYVYCPLHNWKISVTDGKVQDPDEGCVETFPTHLKDGRVLIELQEEAT
ncbi:nitrite reductase small subunit NirD [Bacillus daqingensis]|uniref:Nitrite reductase small subunit NirD n=1 Tax=Bacillus daqingensis TaxID=872396 RepID=A0ABV9NUM3_9BACI